MMGIDKVIEKREGESRLIGERGSVLIVVMIVMLSVILLLAALHELLSMQIFQYRKWGAFVTEQRVRGEISNQKLSALLQGDVDYNTIIGREQRCLLWGDGGFWDAGSGLSISAAASDCFGETYRQLVAVSDNESAYTHYLILEREVFGPSNIVRDYGVFADASDVNDLGDINRLGVVIYDELDVRYEYRLPLKSSLNMLSMSTDISEEHYYLFQYSLANGFYLIVAGDLWLLPKDRSLEPILLGVVGIDYRGDVLASYAQANRLMALVQQNIDNNTHQMAVLTVESDEIDVRFKYQALGEGALFSDGEYQLIEVDEDGVVFIKRSSKYPSRRASARETLFATAWSALPRWADQFEWEPSSDKKCGIGRAIFEPMEGYQLGCQIKGGLLIH